MKLARIKVLFIGVLDGTSRHRRDGFIRLGCSVCSIDPRATLPKAHLIDQIEWHVSPTLLGVIVEKKILELVGQSRFDLVFIDNGSLISPNLVKILRGRGAKVVNFNHDDPFGPRDERRFSLYRKAVPEYDLIVVVRSENVAEASAGGAKQTLLSFRVADEVAHKPRDIPDSIRTNWNSEVSFIGTWMPERGAFLNTLIQESVPVAIYGSGWTKAPEWESLKKCFRRGHLDSDEYAYAVQCSKICLGLLSFENRDLHTTRSLEIPSLGGLLCAQRTTEHQILYQDELEAVFWDSAKECAEKCATLLQDPQRIAEIANNGRIRYSSSGNTTEGLLRKIMKNCEISL